MMSAYGDEGRGHAAATGALQLLNNADVTNPCAVLAALWNGQTGVCSRISL
jgi:hypothetical protein